MENTLEIVRNIARSAPIVTPKEISEKGRADFVTNVDKAVDAYLQAELRKYFPNYGFLTEESKPHTNKDLIWVIDPIDGTTNFLNGFPFAISVALCDKRKNEALLGVVHEPETGTEYFAAKDEGAYKCQGGKIQKLPEREAKPLENSVAILATSYDRDIIPEIFDKAKEIFMLCADIRTIGPAALDVCSVAERKASLYFARTLRPWDYAAGYLILKESGGIFARKNGWQIFAQNKDTFEQVASDF